MGIGMAVTHENPRQLRGLAILAEDADAVRRLAPKKYVVRSQSGNGFTG